jgi:hypothetical protein
MSQELLKKVHMQTDEGESGQDEDDEADCTASNTKGQGVEQTQVYCHEWSATSIDNI